jgi:hypothetical protein
VRRAAKRKTLFIPRRSPRGWMGPSEVVSTLAGGHGKPGIAGQCILRLHASRSIRPLVQNPLRGLQGDNRWAATPKLAPAPGQP